MANPCVDDIISFRMKKAEVATEQGPHYEPYIDGEILNEMALVGYAHSGPGGEEYAVSVDSATNRKGNPYFKSYAGPSRSRKTPAARISFLEPKYIIHYKDSVKNQFKLNAGLKKILVQFFKSPHIKLDGKRMTNWQYAIIQYNVENIMMRDWGMGECLYFTQKWKRDHANEIAGTQAEHALPIDLPMPNYLNLR